MGNATKDASPGMGSKPPVLLPGGSREGGAAGRRAAGGPLHHPALGHLGGSLSPHLPLGHLRCCQGGASLPLVQAPLVPAPGPQAASAGTLQPARHSSRSVPRAIHHGPLSRRPALSREAQTPRKGSAGSPGWAAALPLVRWSPGCGRQAGSTRKESCSAGRAGLPQQ